MQCRLVLTSLLLGLQFLVVPVVAKSTCNSKNLYFKQNKKKVFVKKLCDNKKSNLVYTKCKKCTAIKGLKNPLSLQHGASGNINVDACILKGAEPRYLYDKTDSKRKLIVCSFPDRSLASAKFYYK